MCSGSVGSTIFITFMCRIFEIAPGAVQLFSKLRDLPKDEMYSSEPFRAHALNVTQAVDMAVSSLDDIPGLLSVLKDLGSVHCPYGIQDAHFDVSYLYGT